MADDYECICSLCGEKLNGDIAFYCCEECYKRHRKRSKKRDSEEVIQIEQEKQ